LIGLPEVSKDDKVLNAKTQLAVHTPFEGKNAYFLTFIDKLGKSES